GRVHVPSSDRQAAWPANYAFTAADAGQHTLSATLKTAGLQNLTAADTASASVAGSQGSIAVSPAAASSLAVAGFPASVTAGAAGFFTVTARDTYGNTTADYAGTIHFASSDPQAALPANYTFTAADAGQHTFAATLYTAGSRSLTGTDTANGSIVGSQVGIAVNAASAN